MSLYISETNRPRQGEYDESIGLDIDEAVVRDAPISDTGNPQSYYDYDLLIRGVSGSGVVIPSDLDDGFPKLSDYTFQDTSSKMYQKALKRDPDGIAGAFQLKAFVADDQSATLDTMLEGTNNGLVSDVNIIRDNPLPPETSLVINKDNKDTSIKGILEENSINDIFFSDMNTKVIQDTIRYKVNLETGETVARQSDNELYIIMRSIMYQYAIFQTSAESVLEEVRRLNTKILMYCIENVSSNALQRQQYLKDIETLPTPIDRPSYVDKPTNYTYDISNLLKK